MVPWGRCCSYAALSEGNVTGLNTGICTKGYASFRDNAKVLEPSLCCSVPSRPTSSPGGLATKAETLPPARCGCTRSSMTAFVSSPRR